MIVVPEMIGSVVGVYNGKTFNLVEGLAIVDTNNRSDHLWNNNHVTEMGLDNLRLFEGSSFFLGLSHESPVKTAALSAWKHISELIQGHVEELVQIHPSVGEFTEGPPLLLFEQFSFVRHSC